MELDEMKNQWDVMSKEIEKQKLLTDKLIMDMTQERYNNKLRSISIPETLGTIICFATAIYIIMNLSKLDTWYLLFSGIFMAAFCVVLPILSLKSIKGMQQINIKKDSYKQALLKFAKSRKQFMYVQKVSFYLSFILMVVSLPVAGKLMKNKDLFLESKGWLWYLPLGLIFLYFFSKWLFKRYKRTTGIAENLLKELE